MVAAPAWRLHTLEATDEAVLLDVSDEPLLTMLGWVRGETEAI